MALFGKDKKKDVVEEAGDAAVEAAAIEAVKAADKKKAESEAKRLAIQKEEEDKKAKADVVEGDDDEEEAGYTVKWDGGKKKGLTLDAANTFVARLFAGTVKKVSLRGDKKNCDYTKDDKDVVTKVSV